MRQPSSVVVRELVEEVEGGRREMREGVHACNHVMVILQLCILHWLVSRWGAGVLMGACTGAAPLRGCREG